MSDSELVDGLFLLLSTFLSTERTAPRQPYRFQEHVRAASSAPSHDTSRIFLESGFKAWVAYFVVSPKTANAQGQAVRRRQFAALDRLPVSEKKKLAVKTNEVQPHPTVATLVLSMEREARQINPAVASLMPSKRARTEHDDFGLSSPQAYPPPDYSPSFGDNSLATANPARAADPRATSNPVPAWTHRQYDLVPTFPSTVPSPSSLQLFTDTARGNINSSASPEAETLSGADIAELDLFPEYLAGAIQRYDTDPKTAAVAIRFPSNSIADVNCAMVIEILPNKVERLASLLFNAHLETNGGLREVILPGGLYVVPTQLQGSPPESVAKVFGATTAAALESAPYRKVEVSEAGSRVATRCVTMSECSDASKGAVIKVALGRREASQIYEKLFKSKSKPRLP